MATHTKNIRVGDKEVPALVNDQGEVVMWLDQSDKLTVGRQGSFRTLSPKRRMKRPLKNSPANVIGRVTL